MTNGEKIQTILDVDRDCTEVHGDNGAMTFTVTSDFWNAEYKEPSSSGKPNKSIEEKCPCYYCEHFEIKGLSHCKIHEDAYGDSRCNDYHKINQKPNKSEIPTGSNTKNDISNRTIIYKAKESKEIQEDLNKLSELNKPTANNDLGVDCISRQELLKIYEDRFSELQKLKHLKDNKGAEDRQMGVNYCINILKELPPVTPQEPRWIPCSERLPKDKETVLVTFKHHISGKTIGLGSVVVLRGKPHWHVREQNLGTYDVIAWMPLPTSYETAESEDKE